MNKICYILRACPGAGKSTLAEQLYNTSIGANLTSIICCADDYFIDNNGNYNWDINNLHYAHSYCQNTFIEALLNNINTIIVSNTSTKETDVNLYRNKAITAGYIVFVLTVENWHNGNNIHNVPNTTVNKMRQDLINSIKL